MAKYIKLRTIKVNDIAGEPLLLESYLLFVKEGTKDKFLLLNFKNVGPSRIDEFLFSLREYNREGSVISEKTYEFKGLSASRGERFVPPGKVMVSEDFHSLELIIERAVFASNVYEDKKWSTPLQDGELHHTPVSLKIRRGYNFVNAYLASFLVLSGVSALILNQGKTLRNQVREQESAFTYESNGKNTLRLVHYLSSETEVIIPALVNNKFVTEIGSDAFKDSLVRFVTIYAPSITIADHAFWGAYHLESIEGNTAVLIGNQAFAHNYQLSSFTFDAVFMMGRKVFDYSKKLKELNIGNLDSMVYMNDTFSNSNLDKSMTSFNNLPNLYNYVTNEG